MTKKLLLSIFLFTVYYCVQAQSVPGYMGKRFSIQHNLYTFFSNANPSSKTPKQQEIEKYSNKLGINAQNYLVIEYVISKRASILTSVGYARSYIHPVIEDLNEGLTTKFPKMTAYDFNLGFRVYTQHFAPLGAFFEARLGFAIANSGDFNYTYYNHYYLTSPGYYSEMIEGSTAYSPQFGLAIGVNRVFNDFWFFGYGIDVSIPFTGIYNASAWGSKGVFEDVNVINLNAGNDKSNQDHLAQQAMGRYTMQSLFNLRVGIGIIL